MNKLPKSWCVKNDGSQLFKDTVIKYMNSKTPFKFRGTDMNFYYGLTSGGHYTSIYSDKCKFLYVLSVQEFIELSKEIEDSPKYELTKEKILLMAKESKEVEKSLRKAFPDVFEKDKSVKIHPSRVYSLEGSLLIEPRILGEYEDISLLLNTNFNWELKRDSMGRLILVPTLKD